MTSRNVLRFLFTLSVSIVITASHAQTASLAGNPLAKPAALSPKLAANYGKLPLNFEPNLGQTSTEVQWLARGADYTLFLAGHDAVLELNKITPANQGEGPHPTISESALRMNLIGARTADSANAAGQGKLLHREGPLKVAARCADVWQSAVAGGISGNQSGVLRSPRPA